MLGDDPPVLADDDAVGVGVDVDRAADGPRAHRISVVVEPHEAGLRHRGRQRVEAVEADAIRNELRALVLERLPDRLPALLGVSVRLGPDDTLVDEPGVQLPVALDPQRWCEERSRTRPTWFSTWPFSQPAAGVQARPGRTRRRGRGRRTPSPASRAGRPART